MLGQASEYVGVTAMGQIKGDLRCPLGASQVRRLKGHGFGVRDVHGDGKENGLSQYTPPRETISVD